MEMTLELVTGIIAIITVTYVTVVYYFLREVVGRKQSSRVLRDRFFKVIDESLLHGEIKTFEDVKDLYLGVCKLRPDDNFDKAVIVRWLREYIVERIEGEKAKEEKAKKSRDKGLEEPAASTPKDLQWKSRIIEVIKEYEERSPYSGLPDLERTIINDIHKFLDADDKDSVSRKLSEIIAAIQNRQEELTRLRSSNKWAIPLSVMGVVFAVVFGVMLVIIV